MDTKSAKCYEHFLNYVNINILKLDGAVFMADYENGLRKAILKVFPSSKLFGCWFHFCHAVRRQITTKSKNLAAFIRDDKKASVEYHKLLSLPLLPYPHIRSSFQEIKSDIEKFDVEIKFAKFLEYYEKQWIGKVYILYKKVLF